jgi:hypothetical protein
MDRVRFGRALGFGTRQAMKTLVTAVDAATAENPTARKPQPQVSSRPVESAPMSRGPVRGAQTDGTAARSAVDTPVRKVAHSTAKTVGKAREVKRGLGRGSKRFGEAVWGPVVRLSGVLWLEVSGVFFGLFALLALGYLWKLRGAWRTSAADAASHRSLMGAAIMFVLFGYFCVSSFIRARRRERRR